MASTGEKEPRLVPIGESQGLFDVAARLQAILPVEEPDFSRYVRQELATNDRHFFGTIDTLVREGLPKPDAKHSVGLVIGGGYLLSMLPELPVDIVVMNDRDPFATAWQRAKMDIMKDAETPNEFMERVLDQSTPIAQAILTYEQRIRLHRVEYCEWVQYPYRFPVDTWMQAEQDQARGWHFLSSPERYAQCREELLRKPIVFASMDLADLDKMGAMSEALRAVDTQITFANLTNASEHNPYPRDSYDNGLRRLPFHPEAFVAYSSSIRYHGGDVVSVHHNPIARGSTRGIEAYLGECRKELPIYDHGPAHWNEETFRFDFVNGGEIYKGADDE